MTVTRARARAGGGGGLSTGAVVGAGVVPGVVCCGVAVRIVLNKSYNVTSNFNF